MKKRKIKISIIRIFRMIAQIVFFILLPALFVSTFSGIKQIYLSLINHSFSISGLYPQVIEALAIIPVTILIGRFFCSWMCAFGAMGDFIYLLSQKIFRKKIKISEKMDRILKFTKYGVLLFLIIAVWGLGLKLFEA
ncbi:MAG: 4Fe-4S binding protein, partial [Clostridia bacterium]